jgi:hypothetical protein
MQEWATRTNGAPDFREIKLGFLCQLFDALNELFLEGRCIFAIMRLAVKVRHPPYASVVVVDIFRFSPRNDENQVPGQNDPFDIDHTRRTSEPKKERNFHQAFASCPYSPRAALDVAAYGRQPSRLFEARLGRGKMIRGTPLLPAPGIRPGDRRSAGSESV